MSTPLTRREAMTAVAAGVLVAPVAVAVAVAADGPAPFTVVVMDPLAAPLSCPCVKGYAQRDYEKLGKHLEKRLGRPVQVHFSESLTNALQKKTAGRADLVVGKDSVVRAEAASNKVPVTHVAALTGKDGATTQTGLVVVAKDDPALAAEQLAGYAVYFGPAEADEKHGAALALFKDLGVSLPTKVETCVACTDGATKVIDLHKQGKKVATVISSYAQPLLEGCGTIKKGDLRVVGETDPVPFIAAFASEKLSAAERETVRAALLDVGKAPELCVALETKHGFVAGDAPKKK
jgi:ABC-type phosphate/phosphonate transport system substrate-binding protein